MPDLALLVHRHRRAACAALAFIVVIVLAGCGAQADPAPNGTASVAVAQQWRQTHRLELFVARQEDQAAAMRSLRHERDRASLERMALTQLATENEPSAGDTSGMRYGSTETGDPIPWEQRGARATRAPDSEPATIERFMSAVAAGRITLVGAAKPAEVTDGLIDDRVLRLLLVLSQRHRLTVNSLRISHPESVQDDRGSAVPSNHIYGRAADVSGVDGFSCATETRRARYHSALDNPPPEVAGPCLRLAYEAAAVPGTFAPQEIIYYWRVPGPAGVSLRNHDDHVHLGYRSYGSVTGAA
jgi:hypothetical protein